MILMRSYLNGDRPDVLIMREGNGVMVIEVKDWNLDNFALNEKQKMGMDYLAINLN